MALVHTIPAHLRSVCGVVFTLMEERGAILAGLIGGIAGGLLMPIPALLWSLAAGHGIWYPVNLLAAMAMRYEVQPTSAQLEQYHADWFAAALMVHAVLSLIFGLAFALVLPRMPAIPKPLAWGGLVMPLLWTAMSYGMMGIVNPVLKIASTGRGLWCRNSCSASWRRSSLSARKKYIFPRPEKARTHGVRRKLGGGHIAFMHRYTSQPGSASAQLRATAELAAVLMIIPRAANRRVSPILLTGPLCQIRYWILTSFMPPIVPAATEPPANWAPRRP